MPRKHLVAFVQVLALAVRCLHVDVTYGQGSAGDQPHTCRQEPQWQAAALCASAAPPAQLSSASLPKRLPSVSRDRKGTCVQGAGAKQERMDLTATSDSCLYCL